MNDMPVRLTCLVCDEVFEGMTLFDVTHLGKAAICPKCEKQEACAYCGQTLTDDNARYHKDGLCETQAAD